MLSAILIVLFPFSFLVGLLFPYAVTIHPASSEKPAKGIGSVYIYESLGSMASGGALTFYLILHYTPYQIIALFVLFMLLNSLLLTQRIPDKAFRAVLLVVWFGISGAWAGLTCFQGWSRIEQSTVQQRWKTIRPGIELVESTNSRYENIVIAKMSEQYSIYGNGQYFGSFPDPFHSALQAHFVLSQHPHPEDVLLIGGGVSGIISEILKHPVKALHYVELDAALIGVAQQYLPPENKEALSDPRVKIFLRDGRYYAKQCRHKYDLVIVHVPEPSTAMLNRFYTLDFFRETASILKPDGILVTGVSSSENYLGTEIKDYAASIYYSLTKVFAHVLVTPGEFNYFFAGSKPDVATTDIEILAKRYLGREIESSHFSPHHFRLFLEPQRVAFINEAIKSSQTHHLNTDIRPITYFYSLILWDFFAGGKGRTFFHRLAGLSWQWYVFSIVLVLVLRVVYVSSKRKTPPARELRFNSLYAICSTGFAGMGLEIILLFAYQNIYGHLYQRIGLIIALFMAGLAGGAYLMNRLLTRSPFNAHRVLLAIEAGITGFCLLLTIAFTAGFVLQRGDSIYSELLFMILVLGAGVLTGSEFPLVSEILIQAGFPPGKCAGVVDGFDHLGACAGAALTGTFLVPLLGIVQSSLFIGMLNLVSCLFIILFLAKKKTRGLN
jgi:spermidine synthase